MLVKRPVVRHPPPSPRVLGGRLGTSLRTQNRMIDRQVPPLAIGPGHTLPQQAPPDEPGGSPDWFYPKAVVNQARRRPGGTHSALGNRRPRRFFRPTFVTPILSRSEWQERARQGSESPNDGRLNSWPASSSCPQERCFNATFLTFGSLFSRTSSLEAELTSPFR